MFLSVLFLSTLFASRPVATITSAEPFALDGHSINTPGVTSFPIVVGDTVGTLHGPAVLLFKDGSELKLGANSSVQIAGAEVKPKVVLLGGALDFKLTPGSNLAVTNLDSEHKNGSAAKVVPSAPAPPAPTLVASVSAGAAGANNTTPNRVFFPRDRPALAPEDSAANASASFAGTDGSTLGNWTGKYGSDGLMIPGLTNNVPSYATISLVGETTAVTQRDSSDPRALQTASGSASRIASEYANNFTIDMSLNDGYTHRVALYLADFDNANRSETVTIFDATTKEILSTQTFTSFSGGVYEAWNIMGHVQIQVTGNGGAGAVVNGIFFDAAGPVGVGTGPDEQTPATNGNPPSAGNSGASAPPNAHAGIFDNPKFLVPIAGAAAAGLAIGLLSLPPVSRHL